MKRPSVVLLCLLLISPLASPVASAADRFIGLDFTSVKGDDIGTEEFNPLGVRLRFAMPLTDRLDIDLHFGSAVAEADADNPLETRVRTVGAFLTTYLPVGERSALYATAGYARVQLELSYPPLDPDTTLSRGGLSWGFGATTLLTDRLALAADFLRYELEDEGDESFPALSSVSMGIRYHF